MMILQCINSNINFTDVVLSLYMDNYQNSVLLIISSTQIRSTQPPFQYERKYERTDIRPYVIYDETVC